MKIVWIAVFSMLAASAWADEPQFRCETMVYAYNAPNMHPIIKTRIVYEVAVTWHAVTGHEIEMLDDMFVYLNCLAMPNGTVREAVQKVFQSQQLGRYTER